MTLYRIVPTLYVAIKIYFFPSWFVLILQIVTVSMNMKFIIRQLSLKIQLINNRFIYLTGVVHCERLFAYHTVNVWLQ